MSIRFDRGATLAVSFGLGLLGACFAGEFAQGYPCTGDADCGPALACIDGLCGGPGEAAVCGNGLVEVGEDCDDGNIQGGDGCSENCDFCGDGITQAWEECDDGNTAAGDACTPVCRAATCGDGFPAPSEACDDGNHIGTDGCTPSCALPACGDGFVNHASEACDDGNGIETDACTTACAWSPEAPVLELELAEIKQFQLSWAPARGAVSYQLFERADVDEAFVQIGGDLAETETAVALTVPLHFRPNASYMLRACNAQRCADSAPVDVVGTLAEAVGYFKASNTQSGDRFGTVALSDDGTTMVVGASGEDSNATGIDGDQYDDSGHLSEHGAVYVFVQDEQGWTQQAYVKASQNSWQQNFGTTLALSGDGDTFAVGGATTHLFVRDPATQDWSQQVVFPVPTGALALSASGDTLAIGNASDAELGTNAGAVHVFVRESGSWVEQGVIRGDNTDAGDFFGDSVALSDDGHTLAAGAHLAGAAYVFVRDDGAWSQQGPHVQASNIQAGGWFGYTLALSGDGETLAVSASTNNNPGPVYVFTRESQSWTEQAQLEASNTGDDDRFGIGSVALSADGNILAVGASLEDSRSTGIDGEQNDLIEDAGAVYVFVRDDLGWSEQVFVKAPYAVRQAYFGGSVALSGDGTTLAVGAIGEGSSTTGIGGDQLDDGLTNAGAVYLY
jgi:cysteine-rich repeat protein